jgi:hypothetical protein
MGKRTVVPDDDNRTERRNYEVAKDRAGVRFGVTKNLGDYNSLVFQTWLESDLQDDESMSDAQERLYRECEAKVEAVIEDYEI